VICFVIQLPPLVVVAGVVRGPDWGYVGAKLATRVQLCGQLVVSVDGRRVEGELPGRQGRLLLAYLTLNRLRLLSRTEVVDAIWADRHDGGLAPLLSKLRRVVPLDGLRVSADWVDVEAAADSLHRAESALAQGDPHRAWGPSQVAMFISERPLLAGEEAEWIEDERRSLARLRLRARETYAEAALGIGGTELAAAVRVGRWLVALEPFRESGYRILIEALEREGNGAEAIMVYEQLRTKLREELGITPSERTQESYRRLLG
jgi:SARP family transcriptional regulator, regulator of embCAB operon